MSELLGLQPRPSQPVPMPAAANAMPKSSGMHPKLVKADFHGSIMTGEYMGAEIHFPALTCYDNSRSK